MIPQHVTRQEGLTMRTNPAHFRLNPAQPLVMVWDFVARWNLSRMAPSYTVRLLRFTKPPERTCKKNPPKTSQHCGTVGEAPSTTQETYTGCT